MKNIGVQWQKDLHKELEDFSIVNPLPNTEQDLKIYQLAGYDASKVKAIRKLMEEDSRKFLEFVLEARNEELQIFINNNPHGLMAGYYSEEQLYKLYQQRKP